MGGKNYVAIRSAAEWTSLLRQSATGKQLLVAYFTATWCGPCQMIGPEVDKLSVKYPAAFFLKVDIDENRDLPEVEGIRGVPTFRFFLEGIKVDEFSGANIARLADLVAKHYVDRPMAFQGQGRTLVESEGASVQSTSASSSQQVALTGVDDSLPTTSIQIRKPDGKALVGKFNLSQKIADIREFIIASDSTIPAHFQLLQSYPKVLLADSSRSIEEANLGNASLMVKI